MAEKLGGDRTRARAWSDPVRAVTRILDPRRAGAGGRQARRSRQDRRLRPVRRRGPPARHVDPGRGAAPPPGAAMTARSSGWACTSRADRTMADIADAYGLHELAVEDAVKAEQRPKLEQFGEIAFLVLRSARYVEHGELTETSEVVETGQVMLFIGPEFVISIRHGDACRLAPVRAGLESRHELMAQRPVGGRVRDHRPRGRPLPRGRRRGGDRPRRAGDLGLRAADARAGSSGSTR